MGGEFGASIYSRVVNIMDLFCPEINSYIGAPCGNGFEPNSQRQFWNSLNSQIFFFDWAASGVHRSPWLDVPWCDAIFCKLAKHIICVFSRFFEGASRTLWGLKTTRNCGLRFASIKNTFLHDYNQWHPSFCFKHYWYIFFRAFARSLRSWCFRGGAGDGGVLSQRSNQRLNSDL
jgi:hypothetical protein